MMKFGGNRKPVIALLAACLSLGSAITVWAGTPCPSPLQATLVPGGTCQNVTFHTESRLCQRDDQSWYICPVTVYDSRECSQDRPVNGGCPGGIYANNAVECDTYQQPLYGNDYSASSCQSNGGSCTVTGPTYPSASAGYNTTTPCDYE